MGLRLVWFEVGQAVGEETSWVSTKRFLRETQALFCLVRPNGKGELTSQPRGELRRTGRRDVLPRGCNSSTSRLMGLVSMLLLWPWRSGLAFPYRRQVRKQPGWGAVASQWARPTSAQGHLRGLQKVEVTGNTSSLAHLFSVRLHFRGQTG